MKTQQEPYRIVIVGGGSAGWLLAGRLANHYLSNDAGMSITLIESPEIPSVGVGEGSWPTMRKTLRQIGIKESDFLRACGASFKQGTKFINWFHDSNTHHYFHPFEPPRGHDYCNVGQRWLDHANRPAGDFSSVTSPQVHVCEKNLAPKTMATAEYQGMLNYGYHFDALALGELLRRHVTENLGVEQLSDNVIDVIKDDDGWIDSVKTSAHGEVKGDLFLDCSGFHSLLLNRRMGVPFKGLKQYLFVDTAIALQVPYLSDPAPIDSTTNSTAHSAGWIWDIPMRDRRGVGAVYSSAHMSEDEATSILFNHVGEQGRFLSSRKISFDARYLERFWEKNTVAVGLSAGFVEPLEASALVLIEASADWFCSRLPKNRQQMTVQAKQYNKMFASYWEQIVGFLKFHYVLSERSTPFWQDNKATGSIPEQLLEHMQIWQDSLPCDSDFCKNSHIFSWQSFQYIYLGMHSGLQRNGWPLSDAQIQLASRDFELNKRITEKALESLPGNRELLALVSKYDFTRM